MANELGGKRVAIVATDGFEQDELLKPRQALDEAGAKTQVISPKADKVKGWEYTEWGTEVPVDRQVGQANPDDYDALMLPGGVMNPDHLRMDMISVRFVESFVQTGKPIAAICHGPQTLIEAGAVRGRRLTSFPSIKTDLRNAGAEWLDQEVVVDQGLVTSRKPDDIPAFNRKMIEEFAEGRHPSRQTSSRSSTGSDQAGPAKEGTFAGTKEKSVRENIGVQGRGQN
jgi:protease I